MFKKVALRVDGMMGFEGFYRKRREHGHNDLCTGYPSHDPRDQNFVRRGELSDRHLCLPS